MLEIILKLKQLDLIFFFIIILFVFYLIGSIPIGLLIGKIFIKKDLRILGSKNIGASNAARVFGFKYGVLVFILDFAKGFFSIFLGPLIMIKILNLINFSNIIFNKDEFRIYFGLVTILGQMFSIFNGFKGGKAIATSVGVISFINPFVGLFGILSFIVLIIFFGYAFFASLISTLLVNFLLWIFFYFNFLPNYYIYLKEIFVICLITFLVFYKHLNNIINWIKGKENKFIFFTNKK
nr:glycerol-3-phosphate 1-O-acyltransferase PlsY [Candidatus Phytoplasma sacchari]KAB8122783.1 glycerol-3-phosphate 1-O-acyltransferase PlsY [Candidatus Phytoplasma sacchari]